jgi:hypothetical protein
MRALGAILAGGALTLAGAATATAEEAGGEPQMAIVTELQDGGTNPLLHFMYNLGGNWLDLEAGFSFVNISPDGGDSTSIVALELGGSYRMYKDMDGMIHPYLAPGARFALSTDEAAGEPKVIGVGAQLGVDFMMFDQFSLGAALGAGLDFEITEAANTLAIFTYTTSINATFWWGG